MLLSTYSRSMGQALILVSLFNCEDPSIKVNHAMGLFTQVLSYEGITRGLVVRPE